MMRTRVLLPLVLCASAALYATNHWIASNPPSTSPIVEASLPSNETPRRAASWEPRRTAVVQTFARPLFSPNRRKFVKAPKKPVRQQIAPVAKPVETAAPPDPPRVQLVGVRGSPDALSALVRQDDDHQWVKAGDELARWTVSSVDAQSLTLVHSDRTLTVRMFDDER